MKPTSKRVRRWVAAAFLVGTVLLVPGTALAGSPSDNTGRDYGQHVVSCAHEAGGFNGTHNPGMHQGFTGWDGRSC